MGGPKTSRIYYRKSPAGVVVVRNGEVIAEYQSTDELIETHIKGILAKDQQDTTKIREILRSYRSNDSIGNRD